jgi:hypothetical protein
MQAMTTPNPLLWIIAPNGAVETFFPCALGAEPAVPPGYVLSRAAPAPKIPPPIRVITLQAFISRLTPVEVAIMWGSPVLMQTLLVQMTEPGTSTVNLDSPRLLPLLGVANLSAERIAALMVNGSAAEAA